MENYNINDIYANTDIKVSVPLTGKVLPTEFKNMICDCIARDYSNVISDELLANGFTDTRIERGSISILLTINKDGTFSDELILEYKCVNSPYSTIHHRFMPYDIPRDYVALFRKKALRILKRRSEKGLKQFAQLSSNGD